MSVSGDRHTLGGIMNKALQLAVALGGAGIIVAAGSAYTANGISGMPGNAVFGTDTTAVTGATISATDYTITGNVINAVIYTTTADMTGNTATLVATGGTPAAATCVIATTTTTCTVADPGWDSATVNSFALTYAPA